MAGLYRKCFIIYVNFQTKYFIQILLKNDNEIILGMRFVGWTFFKFSGHTLSRDAQGWSTMLRCSSVILKYLNWTYIRHSEDAQEVFWMSYVRSIYVLCQGVVNFLNFSHDRAINLVNLVSITVRHEWGISISSLSRSAENTLPSCKNPLT